MWWRSLGVLGVVAGCLDKPPFAGRDGAIADDGGSLPELDEDRDGIVDAQDPCPHLPVPQADNDSDGIGDDCDLDPNGDGEIVRFWGFADGNLDELTLAAKAQVDGGDLVLTASATGAPAFLFAAPYFRAVEVDVGFEITASSGPPADLRIYSAKTPPAPDEMVGAICELTTGNGTTTYLRVLDDVAVYEMAVTADDFVGLAGRLHLLHIASAALECATLDLSFGQPVDVGRGGPISRTGPVGLSVKGATVRLRYLFVVGRRE